VASPPRHPTPTTHNILPFHLGACNNTMATTIPTAFTRLPLLLLLPRPWGTPRYGPRVILLRTLTTIPPLPLRRRGCPGWRFTPRILLPISPRRLSLCLGASRRAPAWKSPKSVVMSRQLRRGNAPLAHPLTCWQRFCWTSGRGKLSGRVDLAHSRWAVSSVRCG